MSTPTMKILEILILLSLAGHYLCQDSCTKTQTMTYTISQSVNGHVNMTLVNSTRYERCVNMSSNHIICIDKDTFLLHWTTLTLDLSHNLLSELHPLVFKPMLNLQYLYVSHNNLTSIPDKLFKMTPWLKLTDFSYNKLTDVSLAVFNYSLKHLRIVDLSHNLLTSYEPWSYVYPGVENRRLDVSWNQITRLTNKIGLQIGEKHRKTVYKHVYNDLQYNNLSHWDDNYLTQYFTPPINVETAILSMLVDTRNNPWTCDCLMYSLVKTISNSFIRYSDNNLANITCQNPPELRNKRAFRDVALDELVCNITTDCPKECLCQKRPVDRTLNIDCSKRNLTKVPVKFPKSPYNRTVLNLDDNQILELEYISISKEIIELSIKNNDLVSINDSILADIATNDDAKVDLSNNRLTTLPKTMKGLQHQHVKLTGNQLECSCNMLWMVDWLKQEPKPKNTNPHLNCTFEGKVNTIIELTEDILKCIEVTHYELIIVFSGIIAAVAVLLVVIKRCPYETKVLLYKILRIHVGRKYMVDDHLDTPTSYDMYVSFDDEDAYARQWVRRVLARQLENKKPFYRLCFSCRDLQAGTEAENRVRLMEQSKRVLIVLSEHYKDNKWCLFESVQADCLDQVEGRIVYLLYDEPAVAMATEEPWKSRIRGRKFFTLGERMMWSKLRYELPVRQGAHV